MLIAGWLDGWMAFWQAGSCCYNIFVAWLLFVYELSPNDNYLVHGIHLTKLFYSKEISAFPFLFPFISCSLASPYIYIYIYPFFVDILFSLHSSAGLFSSSAHERPGYKIYDIYVCINFECGWFRCVVAILMLNLFTNIFTSPSIYRYYIRWQSADVVNNCVRLLVQSLVLVSNHTHQIRMHTWRVYDTFNGKRKIHDESCTFYKKKFPSSIIKGMNRWWNSKYFCFAYNVLWNN